MADFAPVTKDLNYLIEKARQALGRQICLQYADEKRILRVLTIDPALEKKIIDSRVETAMGLSAALEPTLQRKWINACSNMIRIVQEQGYLPIILCSEAARPLVKDSTRRELPQLSVISVMEIVIEVTVESLGTISINE